jgi:hypothetical protein
VILDASPTTPKPRRRWLQFSLRTMLVLVLILGCGLACFRGHLGYLTKEEDCGEPIFSHSAGTILVREGVKDLEVRMELLRRASEINVTHGFSAADIHFTDCYENGVRYAIVDYNRWCRRRFQIWNWEYVLDYADEVAEARNAAMNQAIASLSNHFP